MSHADLLAMLLPPVSYTPTATVLASELAAEGQALDSAEDSADGVVAAVTPYFAGQLLPDWERVCGITPPAGAGYQQRQQAVLAKLAETGGLSIPYFKKLAAGMGYQITIDEPQPFRAGAGRVGNRIQLADIVWVWQVTVQGTGSRFYRLRVGQSVAGERLGQFGDAVIEAVLNELKPAHTFVYFIYKGA